MLATVLKTSKQSVLQVEVIKQHAGPVQVTRRVKVRCAGEAFPSTDCEQATGKL